MTESKRGHNFAIQGSTEKKNMYSLIFCTDATYKISSSYLKPFSSFTTTNNAILVKSKKGHNLVNISITPQIFYGIHSKINQVI